jgi:DNA polymerase III epsilon subunit-like protein
MQHHAYFASQEIDDLGDKRRPQILYDIVERVKAYYHDVDVIPVLQVANFEKRISERKRRSESREAVINLLSVMVMTMDLGSLRVGQPRLGGGFFNYSLEWLAKKAEISFSRAKRAMSDLNDAMIISSYQYRQMIDKEKKEYIAHNAARLFDIDFFKMLGIDQQKLGEARKVAHEKQKARQANHQVAEKEKEQAAARLHMKKVMAKLDTERGKVKTAHLPKNETKVSKDKRLQQKRNKVMLELLDDPYYATNSAAFEQVLRERLIELNLLFDHEKKAKGIPD